MYCHLELIIFIVSGRQSLSCLYTVPFLVHSFMSAHSICSLTKSCKELCEVATPCHNVQIWYRYSKKQQKWELGFHHHYLKFNILIISVSLLGSSVFLHAVRRKTQKLLPFNKCLRIFMSISKFSAVCLYLLACLKFWNQFRIGS